MGRTSDANERLMKAALDLTWAESYGAVTIDNICTCAEVKKGSFYYFFDSKADLVAAALEHLWLTDWKPRLDTFFSPAADPLTRITSYLENIYERTKATKAQKGKVLGCPMFSVASEVSTQSDEAKLGGKMRELIGRKRRYFESAIRDAIAEGLIEPCDPEEKSTCLIAMIDGIVGQARIMNDAELLKPMAQMALGLLRPKLSVPAKA